MGQYWFSHHRFALQAKFIDGTFVWLNLHWLLFVTIMPFPIALLGQYLNRPIPIAIYGADLILANLTRFVTLVYMKRRPELCFTMVEANVIRSQVPIYAITNGIYIIAIVVGWFIPLLSYALYASVLVGLMIRIAQIPDPLSGKTEAREK